MNIIVDNISFDSPCGKSILDQVSVITTKTKSAIVGPNGAGKTLLAKIITGQVPPTSGRVSSSGLIEYVPQSWPGSPEDTLLTVLGYDKIVGAIQKINEGDISQELFDLADGNWNWQVDISTTLEYVGFPEDIDLSREIRSLSGGERIRLLITKALLRNPDVLILDEPTNHLDVIEKKKLINWIKAANQHFVFITHDNELIDAAEEIFEISKIGIVKHNGGFDKYLADVKVRQKSSKQNVEGERKELRKEKLLVQRAKEKSEQRASKSSISAKKKGDSKLEINSKTEGSDRLKSRLAGSQNSKLARHVSNLNMAQENSEWSDPISLRINDEGFKAGRLLCEVECYLNALNSELHPPISFTIRSSDRFRVTGRNGSGKTMLIKSIIESKYHNNRSISLHSEVGYLDQDTSILDKSATCVENFMRLCPELTEQGCRLRLSRIRMRGDKGDMLVKDISGGEQLKLALAVVLLGEKVPELLVLDEPTNHLDLDSIAELEDAISNYTGGLIIVSHNDSFIKNVGIEKELDIVEGLSVLAQA